MATSGIMKAAETSVEHAFFRISVDTLRLDTVTGFDLYLPSKSGRAPVLYWQGDKTFTEAARSRIADLRLGVLLVNSVHRAAYQLYLEHNLGAVLSDPRIPLKERTERLYESARDLVQQVLLDPSVPNMLERSSAMVGNAAHLLFTESASFQHLMDITSYDYYTYTHSVNVFVYGMLLAQRLGYGEEDVQDFGQGALLHDIGKSRIDESIVNCTGKLSEEQWVQMKKHPALGDEILRERGVTSEVVLDVARHHHEKLNGTGYPDGLSGGEISRWTRMSTICDIFDAMTTRRSYKEAVSSFASLKIMKDEMTGQIDPDILHTFVQLMSGSSQG